MKLIKGGKFFRNKSCVEFLINGYNIERALDELAKKGVVFFEIEKFDIKSARVQIRIKDKKVVKKYLNERKILIEKEKFLGFSWILQFFKRRVGIAFGAVVALALLIVLNNFFLKVDVIGVDNHFEEEIISVLNQNGVGVGAHLNSVDTDDVEKIILDNFENVSMVSAVKKGNSVVINIKEKLAGSDYEGLADVSPLLATQNGLITDINLIQGTLLVKVGDVVRVGDALVAPYTLDAKGKKIPIIPKAEIIAEVWITGESEHKEVETKTERTGNFVCFRESSFLGKTIFSNKGDNPFENYEIEIKTSYLTDYIFPIKYKEIFYFETKCDIIEVSFEEVRDKKIQEAKSQAYLQIEDLSKIKSEDYSISLNGDRWVVVYTITLSGDIAV